MRLLEKALLFTPEGKQELETEIDLLEHFREEIQKECEASPECTEEALRRELEAVEEQIFRLREATAHGEIVGNTGLTVSVGSEVTVEMEHGRLDFMIVGPVAAPRRGCISYESPLGQALLGAELGEVIDFVLDGDRRKLKIASIRPGHRLPDQEG